MENRNKNRKSYEGERPHRFGCDSNFLFLKPAWDLVQRFLKLFAIGIRQLSS